MGGRDVNDSRQWLFRQSSNDNSMSVERLGNYLNSRQRKDPSGLLITRVFDPCDFTRIQHSHCADQHRLLHTSDDYNLIRMTARCSEIAQVGGKRLAQVGVTPIGCISQ